MEDSTQHVRAHFYETPSELKPVWEVVPFTWKFHCDDVQMISF